MEDRIKTLENTLSGLEDTIQDMREDIQILKNLYESLTGAVQAIATGGNNDNI